VLGGIKTPRLLDIRVFDVTTSRPIYEKQKMVAKGNGVSNCPLCASGHEANKTEIYLFGDMDADHVEAWSKRGGTLASNCQMLCKTHNRSKGNR